MRIPVRMMILIATIWLLAASWPAHARWATQELTLNPGWNAVFFEVQPESNRTESVFGNVPVRSVWAWNERFTSVQYVRDPNTLLPEQPEWLTFYPASSNNAFLSNLFVIHGAKAYLIELDGDQPVTLTLYGELVYRKPEWLSNSFNLVGFHLDPANPTTFGNFFGSSPAHDGKAMYRLNAAGAWVRIDNPGTEAMERGSAYWVYCEGQSTYAGPLGVDLQIGRGLDYGRVLEEQMLRLTNSTDQPKNVTFAMRPSTRPSNRPSTRSESSELAPLAGDVQLAYRRLLTWEPMVEPLTVEVEANSVLGVEFAVLRSRMVDPASPDSVFESVLDVSDGEGQLFRIPVTAEKNIAMSGLWVGTATVSAVSEAGSTGNLTVPTSTASEFRFRLIVHVDDETSPKARLLQQVFLMQTQPVFEDDPDNPGTQIEVEPARYVLLTDESLLEDYEEVSMRDGELVGRRISSSVFGFKEPIELLGSLTDTLTCSVLMPYTDPLNPFVHKFHPDHDNLDGGYENTRPEGRESFTFTRDISLEFSPTDPYGLSLPGYGHTVVGGTYREKIRGVHQEDIYVMGRFELNHVVSVGKLNDGN